MPRLNLQDGNSRLALVLACSMLLPACNINVKKNAEGQDQKVDIETPMGGIHVSKDAEIRDIGLPVYPGAQRKQKGDNGNETNANVSLSSSFFGLRVAAIEYISADPPEKLVAYYKDQLKRYGDVLECHTSHVHPDIDSDDDSRDSKQLKCDSEDKGKAIELKVGTKQNQHIVSIQPADSGKGTDFGLVYVQLRGGKGTI
ncbi:MAG TPA: hypothetical protein VGZ28_06340 [Terriglobales bacterium]|jgi:hypothetical protein|nr:hypothetical protein [Terriglobales bacterium]